PFYSRRPQNFFWAAREFCSPSPGLILHQPINSGAPDMTSDFDRRELIALAGLGGLGIIFGSAVATPAAAQVYGGPAAGGPEDFFFIQLSDTHWGFKDDGVNPDAAGTFKKVVNAVNALSRQPDFIAFTGDMTHT